MKSNRPYLLRALYEWIVDCSCTPYIAVKADEAGVDVPAGYIADGRIVLNISPASIRDLLIDDARLSFDGRFGGNAYRVSVPTGAVIAIYAKETGQGMAFEVESPTPAQNDSKDLADAAIDPNNPPRKGPSLRVIK